MDYTNFQGGISAPAFDAATVVVDTAIVPTGAFCRSIWVGTTGDISVVLVSGNTAVFKSVPVGILPICATKVNSSGTTASNMTWMF